MQNTVNFAWPHPESGDHTRTWEYWDTFVLVDRDLKTVKTTADTALSTANSASAAVAKLPTRIQSGNVSMSVSNAGSTTKSVTFPTAFTGTPSIFTNMTGAAGPSAGWITRAINGTSTGFTAYMAISSGGTPQTFSATVDWLAAERTATPT